MSMKVSSLVKLFGIAAAGFVPQAQANPFGISFVKVAPPKDKKEEVICFRLKLSQTDAFSEHNFTDITFRPDTTVFLQKNMLIDDEEEILKKTFKNFDCEKDPFEIPDKYLPLEDKDRAEWVDKDGKPLKFLVALRLCKAFLETDACLCISGKPKQTAFYICNYITFLDGSVCVLCEYAAFASVYQKEALKRLGLKPKRTIACMIVENAMHWNLPMERFDCVEVLLHVHEKFFQVYHVSSGSYYEISHGTRMRSPFLACERLSFVEEHSGMLHDTCTRNVKNKNARTVQVIAYDLSQPAARYCTIISPDGETLLKQQKDGRFLMVIMRNTDAWGDLSLYLDVTDKNYPEELGKPHRKIRLYDVDNFAFFFPMEGQAQPQK